MIAIPALITLSIYDLILLSMELKKLLKDFIKARSTINNKVTIVKKIIFIIKINNKIHKPTIYKKAIFDPISKSQ